MINDAGLEHLKGMTQLHGLFITHTNVSDAGMEHLKGLTQLEVLDARYTKVSDAGLRELQQELPNTVIGRPHG